MIKQKRLLIPFLGVIIVALAILVVAGLASADDKFEENDEKDEAAEVKYEKYEELYWEDWDWYKIYLRDGDDVKFFIEFDSDEMDLDLYLENEDGDQLDSSEGYGDTEEVQAVDVDEGWYYASIDSYGADGEYFMEVSNEVEEPETIINIAQAINANGDDNVLNDCDFFAHIEDKGIEGVDITIFDQWDNEVASGTTNEDGEWQEENMVNGDYYWTASQDRGDLDDHGTFDVADRVRNVQGYCFLYNMDWDEYHNDAYYSTYDSEYNGVADAEIEIYDANGTWYSSGVTDGNGEYTEFDLPEGDYTFEIYWEDEIFNTGWFHSYGGESAERTDEWFESWDYETYDTDGNRSNDDTIEIYYNPDTEADEIDIFVYIEVQLADEYYDDLMAEYTIYGEEEDWFSQIWTADQEGSYDFYVDLYDDDYNREDSFEINDVYLYPGQGGGDTNEWFEDWDYETYDTDGNRSNDDTIEIFYDPDTEAPKMEIEVYIEVYLEDDWWDDWWDDYVIEGDDYDWFSQTWTADEEGSYDFYVYLYDDEYNEEDYFEINDVYLYPGEGGGDTDEWFFDWDYETYDTDGNRVEDDTIEIYYDPDTEADSMEVEVYIDIFLEDKWYDDISDFHRISGEDEDWFSQIWTADVNGTYDFFVTLYDNDGNKEDSFDIMDIYLAAAQGGGDTDEWFADWDYNTYDTNDDSDNDTIDLFYDPDTEAEQMRVQVEVIVYHEGKEYDRMSGSHTIKGEQEDWFRQSWTSDMDGYYDFDVSLYDDEGQFEDSFYYEDIYLHSAEGERTYLEGWVTEGDDSRDKGDPIYDAHVELSGNSYYDTYTDDNGYYYIDCEDGDYDIEITHEDYEDHFDEIFVAEGDNQYDAELTPIVTYLEGFVTEENRDGGDPIEDALVEIVDLGIDTMTDDEGYYYIECEDGSYTVKITHDGFEDHEESGIDVYKGANQYDVTMTVVSTYLEGTIMEISARDSGDPVKGAHIEIETKDMSEYFETWSDGEGYYYLDCEVDEYTLWVTHDDYQDFQDDITIETGDNYLDIELEPNPPKEMVIDTNLPDTMESGEEITVVITITEDSRGDGIEDVDISILLTEGAEVDHATGKTNQYGKFTIKLTADEVDEDTVVTVSINGEKEGYEKVNDELDITVLAPKETIIGPETGNFGEGGSYEVTAGIMGDGELDVSVIPNPDPEDDKNIGLFLDITFDGNAEDLLWVYIEFWYDVLPSGITDANLAIYYWEDDVEVWNLAENTGVNTDEGFVWSNITHLTIFAPRDEQGTNVETFDVEITGDTNKNIQSGEKSEFSLTIENTGESADMYLVEVTGDYKAWVIVQWDDTLLLNASESRTFAANVTIPADTPGGTYTFTVTVTSQGDDTVSKTHTLKVVVTVGDDGTTDGDSPGFVLAAVIAGFGLAVVMRRRR